MIGELYEQALAGLASPEIEYADGRVSEFPVHSWFRHIPGDGSCWTAAPDRRWTSEPGQDG